MVLVLKVGGDHREQVRLDTEGSPKKGWKRLLLKAQLQLQKKPYD